MRVSSLLQNVIEASVRAKAENKSQALFKKYSNEEYLYKRKLDKLNENIINEIEPILKIQVDSFFKENKDIFIRSGYFGDSHISDKEDFIKYCCRILKEKIRIIFSESFESETLEVIQGKSNILKCTIDRNIRNIIITLENDDNKENLKDLLDKVNFD